MMSPVQLHALSRNVDIARVVAQTRFQPSKTLTEATETRVQARRRRCVCTRWRTSAITYGSRP